MVIFHLAEILEEKDISQRQLSKGTKIRPGTINAYYHGFIERINKKDLDKLCKFLDCRLDQLIEYVPDKKEPTD